MAPARIEDAGLDLHVGHLLTQGGDERLWLDAATGVNRYLVAPHPTSALCYSSSTANHVSAPAYRELCRRWRAVAPKGTLTAAAYRLALADLRSRIRAAWVLPVSAEIVFAASGTDLEYVPLALANHNDRTEIDNILLGADEVGSGCIYSANARHFASNTPLGFAVAAGQPLCPRFAERVRMIEVTVRSATGSPTPSEDVLLELAAAIEDSLRAKRQPLVHVVHGSKTGLILPSLSHIDALRRRFGDQIMFVVDACQARIGREAILAYLSRGAIVLVTGSKFMGGPPFSGFAIVPARHFQQEFALPAGIETIFSRAEWPDGAPGSQLLADTPNAGLLLRLEAAIYELELFQRLAPAEIKRTLDYFDEAVGIFAERIRGSRMRPAAANEWQESRSYPLEMRTLATLDISDAFGGLDHEGARKLYLELARPPAGGDPAGCRDQVILGQPVKCIPVPGGNFAGTLRLGLSMPQMTAFSALDSQSLREHLQSDMTRIGNAIITAAERLGVC